jgi:hypothetical protein
MERRISGVMSAALVLALPALVGGLARAAQPTPPLPSLAGTIDVHTHSEPDSTKRVLDVFALAKLAHSRGMRGIVIKSHYEPTASIAYLVRQAVPGLEAFGGITMDRANGGINPAAVENMAKVTGGWGRIVWMPTFDSEAAVRSSTDQSRPYVSVARDGDLLPQVKEVIAIIAKHGLVLATGHSSADEGLMLLREGRKQGVRHMIVTHATNAPIKMTVPQMQEAARTGAFIEFCYLSLIGQRPQFTASDFARMIRAIGPESVILSTDLGQPGNPVHPDGLAAFIAAMSGEGFSQRDLAIMTRDNPARLLDLPIQ